METLNFLVKKIKSEVWKVNTLEFLLEFQMRVNELIEKQVERIREEIILELSVDQIIDVNVEDEFLKFKILKITPNRRIHARGLEGKYFNEVFTFPPDVIVIDSKGGI